MFGLDLDLVSDFSTRAMAVSSTPWARITGKASDGLAHDGKRIGHLLAHPIVGLLQEPLKEQQQTT